MALTQLTFDQMVNKLITAYNAQAESPANVGLGSPLGAIFNSVSLLSLDMQLQILYTNNLARLQTSSGADIDTFVTPFGVSRNLAVPALNSVVFTLNTISGTDTVIPVGTYIQTPSGIQFRVAADAGQTGYSSGANGYVIVAGQLTVQATVQAVIPGAAGNVQANTISLLVSMPGFTAPSGMTVNNGIAFINGTDQESDAALIVRFQQYMSNRFATVGAVANATATAQNGLTYQILDMMDPVGNSKPNFFSVIVNVLGQNSGPTTGVLNAVNAAVRITRPVGMPYIVTGPTLIPINVSATLTLKSGASGTAVQSAAAFAIDNYINNIGLNPNGVATSVSYAEISSLLLAVTGVANVTALTVNSSNVDVSAPIGSQLVSGTMTFTTQ